MDTEVNDVLDEIQHLQPGEVDGPLIQEKIDWLDEVHWAHCAQKTQLDLQIV